MSFKEWSDELIEKSQEGLSRTYFLPSDILLIGASDFGLFVNKDCIPSSDQLSRFKTQLDEKGALRAPKTFRSKLYVDSQAVQVTGTALGIVSGAETITYKRRVGHTMKDAFFARKMATWS